MAKASSKKRLGSVGRNVPRAEGEEKVTGRAKYVDDVTVPGMIWGKTIRSTVPRGRVVRIERDPAFDWSGFTFVDHSDIAAQGGRNVVAMIVEDQPFLVEKQVEHQEEAVLLLAHEDRERVEAAAHHLTIVYEKQPAQLDFESAAEVMKEIRITKGDVAAGFASSEIVVEGTYRTGAQEQLYIENNGMIALPEIDGDPSGITVMGSLQCPYYVVKALTKLFGLDEKRVRVVQTTTGGGFGGKEEYPSLVAGHAALLARKARRPVKLVYDRLEDLVATTKRHPSIVRHKTGVMRDGTLVASEIDLRVDGGAYVTLSPVVLSRASIHATGPYRIPHVALRGRIMKTNTPPNGAFRGFGAPQSQFAAEVHMDRIARTLGMDPIELRRKNLLREGDTTATGQQLKGSVSAEETLDRALARHAALVKKRDGKHGKRRHRDHGSDGRGAKVRATGIACFFHGSGFTGGGELRLASRAALELTREGVRILVGSTEIGQGTRTMLSQIVADAMGLPYAMIESIDPDTARVPDSGPTVASRTCMVVGGILERAAKELVALVGPFDSPKAFRKRAAELLDERGRVIVEKSYEKPGDVQWSDETYVGDAYGAYAWGCNIADVEIDPVTYEARCTDLVAAIDIGKAIHPLLVEGQIEGGSLQAVGWALYEDVVMRDGRMANGQLTNYIIPTTLDTPHIAVEIVENPYAGGPFGAKGVGECPVDGPAAAIVNAIRAATGIELDAIPATPERLMQRLAPALGAAATGAAAPSTAASARG